MCIRDRAALRRRERTGVGELVELAQTENMLDHIGEILVDIARGVDEDWRVGNRHRWRAPQGVYRCLDVAPGVSGFVGAKKRGSSLRLVATDLDWSHGAGPEVRGKGEALLLALTGRPVVLDELSGDGVAVLRSRVAA